MRLFSCPSCRSLLFFENSQCLACGLAVGFDPQVQQLVPCAEEARRCRGGDTACNWLVTDGEAGDGRCLGCRMTVDHPREDGQAGDHWRKLEQAKRRLLQGLLGLSLPIEGLSFAFPASGMTGHASGLITVVLSEADDAERMRRQVEFGEPLRTLVGHFRHESGHFYHGLLVQEEGDGIAAVRAAFGDERTDYPEALAAYYQSGAPADWQTRHVSAYASAHPHEDWAETWAHYLHMVDALEIARSYGIARSLPGVADGGRSPVAESPPDFADMLAAWGPLAWLANSLNRSLGHADWYPFALPPAVVDKLRVIHTVIGHLPEIRPQAVAPSS